MKKLLFLFGTAIIALSLTSCLGNDDDPIPVTFPDAYLLARNTDNLMRGAVGNIYNMVEVTSAQLANGINIDSTNIIVNADTTLWYVDIDRNLYLEGRLYVEMVGGKSTDVGSKRIIDCSDLKIETLKMFGTMEIETVSNTKTDLERKIHLNNFGWGVASNEMSLTGTYTFASTMNISYILTKTLITAASTINGQHKSYGVFKQSINSALTIGSMSGRIPYFTNGNMKMQASNIKNNSDIDIEFGTAGMIITHDGTTQSFTNY